MTATQPDHRTRAGSDRAAGILRAAEKTFAQKGYHATAMREVATAAGVGLSLFSVRQATRRARNGR